MNEYKPRQIFPSWTDRVTKVVRKAERKKKRKKKGKAGGPIVCMSFESLGRRVDDAGKTKDVEQSDIT